MSEPTTFARSPLTTDELVDLIFNDLRLKNPVSREFIQVAIQNIELFDRKQSDYGPRNISGFGTLGVIVRMNDKFERLKNLYGKKRRRPVNESIRDTFRDISNYANIALLFESGKWPS